MFFALQIVKTSFSFFKLCLLLCLLWYSLLCASYSLPSVIDHRRRALPLSHRASTSFFFSSMPLFNKLVFFSLIFSCLGFLFVEKALFVVVFLSVWCFPIFFANEANLWCRCFTECVSFVSMVFREVP